MSKKLLLISIIFIVLCSLSAVSASEINSTDDGVSESSPTDAVSTWSNLNNVGSSENDNVGGNLYNPNLTFETKDTYTIFDDISFTAYINSTLDGEPITFRVMGLNVDFMNTYIGTIDGGKAVGNVGHLDWGIYEVKAIYVSDGKFDSAEVTNYFTVLNNTPPLKNPGLNLTVVRNGVMVSFNEKNVTGFVLYTGDSQFSIGEFFNYNGTPFFIDLNGFEPDEYPVAVKYLGNDVFEPAYDFAVVDVERNDPELNVTVDGTKIIITLNKNVTTEVLVRTPCEDFERSFGWLGEDPIVTDLSNLPPGEYCVDVGSLPDGYYSGSYTTVNVTVPKPKAKTIISKDLTKVESAPDRFEANFTDDAGNPLANTKVAFTVNGVSYVRETNEKGTAGLNINLAPGSYVIMSVNPLNNEVYNNTITVLSKFTDNNDLVKYFRNDSQYVVEVLGDDGKAVGAGEKVTFNINGVMYERYTNETGHAKLNINLNPGNYIITAMCKSSMASNNISVLSTLITSDLTKKYGSADPFTAQVLDGTGKVLAGVDVEFNIDGVLYTRTTDVNGTASLDINLMPGKYIITSSYNGLSTGNNVTILS